MAQRVGDAHVYDLDPGTLTEAVVLDTLGAIPVDDYQILLTAKIAWTDPTGTAKLYTVNAALDLDAYDSNGDIIGSWDGGVYPRLSQRYITIPGTDHEAILVEQNVSTLPAGTASLKVSKSALAQDDLGSAGPAPSLANCRISFVLVTI